MIDGILDCYSLSIYVDWDWLISWFTCSDKMFDIDWLNDLLTAYLHDWLARWLISLYSTHVSFDWIAWQSIDRLTDWFLYWLRGSMMSLIISISQLVWNIFTFSIGIPDTRNGRRAWSGRAQKQLENRKRQPQPAKTTTTSVGEKCVTKRRCHSVKRVGDSIPPSRAPPPGHVALVLWIILPNHSSKATKCEIQMQKSAYTAPKTWSTYQLQFNQNMRKFWALKWKWVWEETKFEWNDCR